MGRADVAFLGRLTFVVFRRRVFIAPPPAAMPMEWSAAPAIQATRQLSAFSCKPFHDTYGHAKATKGITSLPTLREGLARPEARAQSRSAPLRSGTDQCPLDASRHIDNILSI